MCALSTGGGSATSRGVSAVAASAAAFQPAPTARAATVARPTFVAFAPRAAPRAMFDMFKSKEPEPPEEPEKAKPKISLDGLMQVMAMGAGAPMLGDLKKTNFKKPEAEAGAALQFELEANNFDLDARGKFFDSGSDKDAEYDNPGFFENLMSGGKLQREYDKQMQQKRKK